MRPMGFGIDWNGANQAVPTDVRSAAEARLGNLWRALSAQQAKGGRSSTVFRMTVEAWSILYTIDFGASLIRIDDVYTGVRAAIECIRAAQES